MNARAPLQISTPDGTGHVVHPDVVDAGAPFFGYRYWMAMTPYPFGRDRDENPCIRVSNDGLSWIPFPGCPDPLVPAPSGSAEHHADTDLVIHDGELRVYYISRDKTREQTRILCARSADGVTWTHPQTVYDAGWAVSPAVVVNGGAWFMWFVRASPSVPGSSTTLLRSESSDGLTFGDERVCDIEIPGHHVWHIDVLSTDAGWEAFITAYPMGRDPARSRLFHATSRDGLSFRLSKGPLLEPSRWSWDNRMIYRSTASKTADGRYRVWYSAASWGEEYGVGYVEGSLDALEDPHGERAPLRFAKFGYDARGLVKYLILRHAPSGAVNVLRSAARLVRGTPRARQPSV